MKYQIGLIVLGVLYLGLGIYLFAKNKLPSQEVRLLTQSVQTYSNQVVSVTDELERQKQVNTLFEKDLETQKSAFTVLTNDYSSLSANLAQVSGTLSRTEETLKNAQQEVAQRDSEIAELNTRNRELDAQALQLCTSITNLTVEIAETQRKLTASEGDKAFLETELKRLLAQKADLERQFNDLTVVRAQLAMLKEERNIARRLEWNRKGLVAGVDQKGAQKLLPTTSLAPGRSSEAGYDLNVEVDSSGSAKVVVPAKPVGAPAEK